MPFIKIWVHLIWSTKNRYPFLEKPIRYEVIKHIRENANEKGIYLDFIGGYVEHLHTLISLKADQSIAQVAKDLKGESSHWVNAQKLIRQHFNWQKEYIAVSISESIVDRVREYIKNQEEHHRKHTFAEEYDLLLKKYGFVVGTTGD
ncbi:transposase [candidate division KSB1 bacterium]|nr:transposase [candidate division KSB1 bacterium]